MDPASETLLAQGGVFGAFFVLVTIPLAIYTRQLAGKLETSQAARVADAREVRDTLLSVTREFAGSLQEQVKTSAEVKGVFERTLATLERVENRIESLEEAVTRPRGR